MAKLSILSSYLALPSDFPPQISGICDVKRKIVPDNFQKDLEKLHFAPKSSKTSLPNIFCPFLRLKMFNFCPKKSRIRWIQTRFKEMNRFSPVFKRSYRKIFQMRRLKASGDKMQLLLAFKTQMFTANHLMGNQYFIAVKILNGRTIKKYIEFRILQAQKTDNPFWNFFTDFTVYWYALCGVPLVCMLKPFSRSFIATCGQEVHRIFIHETYWHTVNQYKKTKFYNRFLVFVPGGCKYAVPLGCQLRFWKIERFHDEALKYACKVYWHVSEEFTKKLKKQRAR